MLCPVCMGCGKCPEAKEIYNLGVRDPKHCPSCGEVIARTATQCKHCGAAIEDAVFAPAAPPVALGN